MRRGTIIQMLVSDAAQRAIWPVVKKNLKPGDALYFSHGFSIAYQNQTGVVPPKDVDVIMVAPKGSGTSVRRNFLTGAGINSSFAVGQDATGRAEERCLAVGIGIGSGYLFPTTFQHEVFSDLTGDITPENQFRIDYWIKFVEYFARARQHHKDRQASTLALFTSSHRTG